METVTDLYCDTHCQAAPALSPVPWVEGMLSCLAPGARAFCSQSVEGSMTFWAGPWGTGPDALPGPVPRTSEACVWGCREAPGCLLSRRPPSGHPALSAVEP